MKNIIVRTISMPMSIRAFTLPDAQGDYNVYINNALSCEQQRQSFLHEQKHIVNDDFSSDLPVAEIERRVNNK